MSHFLYPLFALALFWLWWSEFRTGNAAGNAAGSTAGSNAAAGTFPGATPCTFAFAAIAAGGAVVLTFLETAGELALGISSEQSTIPIAATGTLLGAAIVEEIIFRGWLVIENRGRAALIAGAIAVSIFFAAGHEFLWQYTPTAGAPPWQLWHHITPNFTLKGTFSFTFTILISLYLYAVRFHPRNPRHSLIPCFAAHAARNTAVLLIKLAQGFVTFSL
jgi:membrane protease YdiL (CAAX protease family)